MKILRFSSIAVIIVFIASCSKQEQKVNTDGQNSTQNIAPNSNSLSQKVTGYKWIGQYEFDESTPNAAGSGAQSWNYVVTVSAKEDNTLTAYIQIDGFQTMTRIEAEVKATEKNADFIFRKYEAENVFEPYKKGDKLFSLEINDKNDMITNWDMMKPNIVENQKSGKVMFKKVIS
jgi:PBP1b-binding outer membrane lipoprotein LpoB